MEGVIATDDFIEYLGEYKNTQSIDKKENLDKNPIEEVTTSKKHISENIDYFDQNNNHDFETKKSTTIQTMIVLDLGSIKISHGKIKKRQLQEFGKFSIKNYPMQDIISFIHSIDTVKDKALLDSIAISIQQRLHEALGFNAIPDAQLLTTPSSRVTEQVRFCVASHLLDAFLGRKLPTQSNSIVTREQVVKSLRSHADALEDPLYHLKQELNELVAQGVPPDGLYYKDRPEQGVNNSPEFYRRTYKRFIDADILYLDQLRKMDKALVNAFAFHKHPPKVPTKSKRVELEAKALDRKAVFRNQNRVQKYTS